MAEKKFEYVITYKRGGLTEHHKIEAISVGEALAEFTSDVMRKPERIISVKEYPTGAQGIMVGCKTWDETELKFIK